MPTDDRHEGGEGIAEVFEVGHGALGSGGGRSVAVDEAKEVVVDLGRDEQPRLVEAALHLGDDTAIDVLDGDDAVPVAFADADGRVAPLLALVAAVVDPRGLVDRDQQIDGDVGYCRASACARSRMR